MTNKIKPVKKPKSLENERESFFKRIATISDNFLKDLFYNSEKKGKIKRENKNSIFVFDNNFEKAVFFAIPMIAIIALSILAYPIFAQMMQSHKYDALLSGGLSFESFDSGDFYDFFACPCCGESIDKNCCGMAIQRKEYLDKLLASDTNKNEIPVEMVKKFGFDSLKDKSFQKNIEEYLKANAGDDSGKIEFNVDTKNLGLISQKDGLVTTDFVIENTGDGPLTITGMDTSCMCTTAKIEFEGADGPEFGMSMHGENPEGYELIIPAGEKATLKVKYDPNAHGPQTNPNPQKIIRYVTVVSDDPVDFQKKIRIELEQVP